MTPDPNSRDRPVLVTGAGGQLGTFIVDAFSDRPVVAATRATLDITDPRAVMRTVSDVQPSVIINCAAFNDVDAAEDAPSAAMAANAFAVRSLARAADSCGAALVHFSTDFVFDGHATIPYDEQVSPAPKGTYAASKLLGEWFALDAPHALVLRVESLFGTRRGWSGRRGSMSGILEGLMQGRDVRVFTDRTVSPSYTVDVAAATRHLVDSCAEGLFHVVNTGFATWEQLAQELARLLGVAPRLVPVRLADVSLRAARPRYCVMTNRKLAAAGFEMPTWRDALARWLKTR